MDALREVLFLKSETNAVLPGICDGKKSIQESQRKEYGGVSTKTDPWVAPFYLHKSLPRDHGTIRHHRHRESPSAPGISNIDPNFSECAIHWNG